MLHGKGKRRKTGKKERKKEGREKDVRACLRGQIIRLAISVDWERRKQKKRFKSSKVPMSRYEKLRSCAAHVGWLVVQCYVGTCTYE